MMENNENSKNIPSLPEVFISFLKLGFSAFGGPAILHYIYDMAVEEKKWIDKKTADEGVLISQTIPGIISMQMACYVGLKVKGIWGALLGYLGLGLPAFLIMLFLSFVYFNMHDAALATSAFHGLRGIIVSIVASATVFFTRKNMKSSKDFVIVAISGVLFYLRIHPIIVLTLAALISNLLNKNLMKQAGINNIYSDIMDNDKNKIFIFFIVGILIYTAILLFSTKLFLLTTSMTKIVMLAFGGGYTSLPLMFNEIVEKHKWLQNNTFMDGIILGQITPGPFVITATFVGYNIAGFLGALTATYGVFFPPFFMVYFVSKYFDKFNNSDYFLRSVKGVLCSFIGLLAVVTYRFIINLDWDIFLAIICICAFIALLKKVGLFTVVISGTIISLIYYYLF